MQDVMLAEMAARKARHPSIRDYRALGLFGLVVRHLSTGLSDASLWDPIDRAAEDLIPIERETRRAAERYRRLPPGVALLELTADFNRVDKTLLLLLGQEREPVSVVVDRDNVSVAARFDSGLNFVSLLDLGGGMPTRISVPRTRLLEVLRALGVDPATAGVA